MLVNGESYHLKWQLKKEIQFQPTTIKPERLLQKLHNILMKAGVLFNNEFKEMLCMRTFEK